LLTSILPTADMEEVRNEGRDINEDELNVGKPW
jgi:hypothetical protein